MAFFFFWEQREFEKSFSLLQNNTLSRAELSESSGVAANIHYGDVLIKFGEYLDMLQESFPWIKKQADADKFRTSFLQDGDIVFADTAEDETAGKCCEIRNCGSTVIISGLHTIPCRPVSKFAPGYLGYYLNSAAFHEQLVPLMQGTKVVSISKAALESTLIQYPSDDKEQQKIGALFRGIDRLITLHQCKYFYSSPKSGIFHNEKTNAWEQRKLGEMAVFSKGYGYSKNDLQESGTPIILYGRLYTKYKTIIDEVDTFVADRKGSVYSKGGEVIVPASGETAEDIAIASVVEHKDVILGGDLNVISPLAGLCSLFLALTISHGKPHCDLAKKAQGKSVVHLHNTDLQEIDIFASSAVCEKLASNDDFEIVIR